VSRSRRRDLQFWASRLFDQALALGDPVLVPVRLDTATLRTRAAAGQPVPALLRELVPASAGASGRAAREADAAAAEWIRRLAGLSGTARAETLLELVRTEAAAVLGHTGPGDVDPDRGFLEMGFDSLTAVELRNTLCAVTGLRLPATLLFDQPSPAALARHLGDELPAGTAPAEPAGAAVDADVEVDVDLADATADELFALIDQEFGLSHGE